MVHLCPKHRPCSDFFGGFGSKFEEKYLYFKSSGNLKLICAILTGTNSVLDPDPFSFAGSGITQHFLCLNGLIMLCYARF